MLWYGALHFLLQCRLCRCEDLGQPKVEATKLRVEGVKAVDGGQKGARIGEKRKILIS